MRNGIVIALAALASAACGGADDGALVGAEAAGARLYACPSDTRRNLGEWNTDTGTVSVTNDETDLIVTFAGANGWQVDEWHVFAGTGPVPTNRYGRPAPGRFPYQGEPASPQSQLEVRIPLESIGAGCGEAFTLAIHSVMQRQTTIADTPWADWFAFGDSSWSSYSWTARRRAWAEWDVGFGYYRGGTFEYAVCCTEADEEPAPPEDTCVVMPHFWAQLPGEWPAAIQSLQLGAAVYSKAELLDLLALDWFELGGDISVYLAQQSIAVQLNEAAGATLPADVAAALADADAWFVANADADARLPFGVHKDSAAGLDAQAIQLPLTEFNQGLRGAPACFE